MLNLPIPLFRRPYADLDYITICKTRGNKALPAAKFVDQHLRWPVVFVDTVPERTLIRGWFFQLDPAPIAHGGSLIGGVVNLRSCAFFIKKEASLTHEVRLPTGLICLRVMLTDKMIHF